MKNILTTLPLIALLLSCATRNPHINQAWNVRYEDKHIQQPYSVKHQEKDQLKKLETPSEFFTFYSDDTLIVGKKGTAIHLNRYCLTYEDGSEVSGPVKVELKEVFSKADLMLNNKPTVSDRQQLVSAGAFYLNATASGKNLIITCPEGLAISVPRQSDYPGMQVFNGFLNDKGDINWVAEESALKQLDEENYEGEVFYNEGEEMDIIQLSRSDSWEDNSYFNFSASRFGWINCDAFYEDDRPKSNLIVKIANPLPEDFTSRMFLVFKNMNSVLQVYSTAPDQFESPALPEGEEVYLVCISGNEKVLFSDIKSLTIQPHQMETVALKETREDVLKENISRLNQ